MTHLNLNQTTSSIEVVSSTIIDKLYELAQTNLDETSNVQGNLQVVHAYEDAVTYLLNKFPNLQINVTSGAYIRFADSAVKAICAANWGDGTGITLMQASVVNSLNQKFRNNTNITSFNELIKFINIKELNPYEFNGCSNLLSINLANITNVPNMAFYNCTNLTSIILTNKCKYIGYNAFTLCTNLKTLGDTSGITWVYENNFGSCYSLESIDLSNVTEIAGAGLKETYSLESVVLTSIVAIRQNAFFKSGIKHIVLGENLTTVEYQAFAQTKLDSITYPASLTTMGGSELSDTTTPRWAKCLATTPPTGCNAWSFKNGGTYPIYVPDESLTTYKTASGWSSYSSRLFPLSQFAIDFPNG